MILKWIFNYKYYYYLLLFKNYFFSIPAQVLELGMQQQARRKFTSVFGGCLTKWSFLLRSGVKKFHPRSSKGSSRAYKPLGSREESLERGFHGRFQYQYNNNNGTYMSTIPMNNGEKGLKKKPCLLSMY